VGITFGIVALFMLSSTLPEMLFILSVGYACSGYVMWVWQALARRGARGKPPPAAPAGH
jgi:hypothetical protein